MAMVLGGGWWVVMYAVSKRATNGTTRETRLGVNTLSREIHLGASVLCHVHHITCILWLNTRRMEGDQKASQIPNSITSAPWPRKYTIVPSLCFSLTHSRPLWSRSCRQAVTRTQAGPRGWTAHFLFLAPWCSHSRSQSAGVVASDPAVVVAPGADGSGNQ
jgi:hypothetical protein